MPPNLFHIKAHTENNIFLALWDKQMLLLPAAGDCLEPPAPQASLRLLES